MKTATAKTGARSTAPKNIKPKKASASIAKRIPAKAAVKRKPVSSVRNQETNHEGPYTVLRSVVLNATPSQVWDALTNPEKTKQYFFNCEVFSDWKAGSPITFKGHIMLIRKIEMNGTIEKIEHHKLLKYTLKNDHGDGTYSTSTVTDKLSYNNGETTLTISDNVGNGEGAEERYKKSGKGWDKVLKGLKKVVEA